jgi:PAS domain S-box-containing protein
MPFRTPVSVLSVDDSDATRYARRRILEGAGFSVHEASTGQSALAAAAEHQPTVAVLDIHLPDMDGYEVCRRLKSSPCTAGIAVLQISAMYDSDEARVAALEGGADAYLSEPVDPKVLLATVNALARMRQAEREQRASNRRLELLTDTASRLLANQRPEDFMRELFPKLAAELGLEVYFNYLATEEQPPRLKLHSHSGVPENVVREMEYREFGVTICGRVAVEKRSHVAEDVQSTGDALMAPIRSLGITVYGCHPLIANGNVLGTLSFGSRNRTRFEPADLDLLQAVSNQLAVALDRARAAEELRKRERRIRRLVDANIVGVMLVDDFGHIRDANDIFLNTVGYTRAELEAGLLDWRKMTPPEHLPATDHAFREMGQRGAVAPYEKEYFRKDGSRAPILIGGAALEDSDERLCFVLDLADRKRTEAALRESQKLESLGFLAGGVAHNLNNLLVGIMGNVSLVHAEIPRQPVEQERLETALAACERAAHLASELLAYAGKGRYFPSATSISRLIERDLAAVLRASVPSRIDLRFELDSDAPELKVDSNQVRQIVTNLVQNAVEAIDDRPGRILVGVSRRPLRGAGEVGGFAGGPLPVGAYVVLTVADTGSGIDEETRSKIFDPFFSTKFTGRGLGLSAVSGIARAYGGGVRVISTPGQGSTFEVFLPLQANLAEAPVEPVMRNSRPSVALVVDDEPVVQETVRIALERGGFTVLIANSGERALESVRKRGAAIDLVLLDLSMPGMSGEETLERIRAECPEVPVAICSGYSEEEMAPRFKGKNVQAFVKKPFTAQRLLAAAAALVGR